MSGTRAYITTDLGDTLLSIDTATNAILATIPVGHLPHGVATAQIGNRVYVGNEGSNTVSVIDSAINAVVATIPVGQCPEGIAVNPVGTKVYVVNTCSSTVSVIDTSSNTVIATIPTDTSAQGIVVNTSGSRVYVANGGGHHILVIDTASNTVAGKIFLQSGTCSCQSTGIAISPDGTRLYMSHYTLNSIGVVDVATNTVIGYIPVGTDPEGIALNSTGTRLYVANRGSATVSVIDTLTNSVIATVPVGGSPVAFGQFVGMVTSTPTPTASPMQLILDKTGPVTDQAAAVDSLLLLRDPFPVVNDGNSLNRGPDRNTRVMVFIANLQLAQGETSSSVVVNLIDGNGLSYDVAAEDVRPVPNFNFTQVIFRLPNLPVGTCTIKVKAHNQVSNSGAIRIRI